MATRRGLIALLELLHAEVGEALLRAPSTQAGRLDALVRVIEDDVERLRQQLDELLRSEASGDDPGAEGPQQGEFKWK